MFEKEAKEYEDSYIESGYCERVRDTWRNGAVFGYNKASEWHNLRKHPNDLPKEQNDMLMSDVLLLAVRRKLSTGYIYELGRYNFGEHEFDYSHIIGLTEVIAWHSIPFFEEVKCPMEESE